MKFNLPVERKARQRAIAKRDKEFQKDSHTVPCVTCGSVGTTVKHHIIGRSNLDTRWNDNFIIHLCYFCHIEDLHRHGQKTFAEKYRDVLIEYDEKKFALMMN